MALLNTTVPQVGSYGNTSPSQMMQPMPILGGSPFQPQPTGGGGGSNFINNPGTGYVNNGVTGNSGSPVLGGVLGGLFGPAGTQIGQGIQGAQGAGNAANAQNAGYQNMINQQSNLFGGIQGMYSPYTSYGSNAVTGLNNLLGPNGQAPNYAGFQNTPGYGFMLSQGDLGINRNAAATGHAYDPSTMAALSKFNIGTAQSAAYQPYVNMLLNAAGLGQQATAGAANAGLTTGQNIGQGYVGQGAANASGILGANSANQSTLGGFGNLLGSILGGGNNGSTGGSNSSGILGQAINKWLMGGGSSPTSGAMTGFSGAGSGLTNLGGDTTGYFGSAGGMTNLGNASGPGYFGTTDMTGGLGSYSSGTGTSLLDSGFSTASGGAAAGNLGGAAAGAGASDLGTGATAYGADLGAETAAAAPSGAGAGSGLMAVAGPYLAAAAPLAMAAYGASKPAGQLNSTWYNNFGNEVGAGLSPNATVQQKLQAGSTLDSLGLMQMNGTGGGTGFSTSTDFNMGRLMDTLKPYGITNLQQAYALANQLFNSIPEGQMPTTGPRNGTKTV